MKNLIMILSLFFSIIAIPCYGILPPLYHTVSQIKGIFDDPEFANHFDSGESIELIEKTAEGWKIKGTKHQADVRVDTLPSSMPGPAKFKFIWQ